MSRGLLTGEPEVLAGLLAGEALVQAARHLSEEGVRKLYGECDLPIEGMRRGVCELSAVGQTALCVLDAFPADAGLPSRIEANLLNWLQRAPAGDAPVTRLTLTVGARYAVGEVGVGNEAVAGAARALAVVAAGVQGESLMQFAMASTLLTHPCAESALVAGVAGRAAELLRRRVPYESAWRQALEATCEQAILPGLGGTSEDIRAEVEGQRQRAMGDLRSVVSTALSATALPFVSVSPAEPFSSLGIAIRAARSESFTDALSWVVPSGGVSAGVGALTGAIMGARGLLPPQAWLERLRSPLLWESWPVDYRGAAVTAHLRGACSRAAGVFEASDYPAHTPAFRVHRFQPQVLYGRNPIFADEAKALADAGVTHVLDLRHPVEWAGEGRRGKEAVDALENEPRLRRLNVPIFDGGPPSREALSQAVSFIDAAIGEGGCLFLHCRAGRERTAAVLLAWMMRRGGDLARLRELAPQLSPLPGQSAAVFSWLRRAP